MKKFFKWSLITLAVMLVAAGGYAYYIFNIKTYDTADKEVDKIVKTAYEIKLPKLEGNLSSSKNPSEPVNEGPNTEKEAATTTTTLSPEKTASSEKTATTSTNITSSDKNDPAKKSTQVSFTAEQIKAQYRPSFESLQSQANGKLSSLMGHAKAEYSQKAANGETISVGYFAQKYKGAAAGLEASTNSAFNTIYGALQSDLKRYGYSASEAQEFKTHYENEKAARRNELLSQVAGR